MRHIRVLGEQSGELRRELARIAESRLGLLRIDHGRIDREIAMRRIARRLDDETVEIESFGQPSGSDETAQKRRDAGMKFSIDVHDGYSWLPGDCGADLG